MKKILIAVFLFAAALLPGGEVGFVWKGKGDAGTLDKDGIYVWFVAGLRPLPGEYKIVGRLRSANSGTFTIKAVNHITGEEKFTGAVKTAPEYADYEFGTLKYDGSWPIRIVDWNAPGYYVESIRLVPVQVAEPVEVRGDSADSVEGWIPMYHSQVAADSGMKKEGKGSIRVTVDPKNNAPWYDLGVMKRLTTAKAGMVSFWIRFDDVPKPVWVQLIGATDSAARQFRPEEFGITAGTWKLVELPVSSFHFSPERETATEIRAVAINPECKEKCSFRIDDLLLE